MLAAAILTTQQLEVQASDNDDEDNDNANDNSGKNPISDALRWGAGGLEDIVLEVKPAEKRLRMISMRVQALVMDVQEKQVIGALDTTWVTIML